MPPLVSVITPTYNRARLVTRAIESARTQSYHDLEVIVVNDGSTDETQAILAQYRDDKRVRVVHLPTNRGVTAAKNAGLDAMSGKASYFGILDSDDELLPGAIARLVDIFEASTGAYSQVFGWCRDRDSGALTGEMVHREGPVTYDDALTGRFSGEFWQLARADLVVGRRFDERAVGAESSVWWPMLRERPAWLIPDVVRVYDSTGADRVSSVAYSRAIATGRMYAELAGLDVIAEDLRAGYPHRYGHRLMEVAKWAALAGDRARARAAAREALRYVQSPRAVAIAVLSMLPQPVARSIAGWRDRLRDRASDR